MEFLRKLGTTKLLIIAGSAVALLIILAALVFTFSSSNLSPLYTNLTEEDQSLIAAKLYSLNIPFRSDPNGNRILVPIDKVPMLRINLAKEGLPSSGNVVGYEIFDKTESLGTSQFVYNVNLVRALEGELSRTIDSIDSIESSRVHLVIPKKELFSKVGSEPSASVVVKIKGNKKLPRAEISAIANFITTAIPGLSTEKVTIIDTRGRPLKLGGEDEDGTFDAGSTALEYKASIENKLKGTIEHLVESYVGEGNVKANVAADIDFDREVINSEVYDPDGQVVRSRRFTEEQDKDAPAAANVSVANNIPNQPQQQVEGNVRTHSKSDETVNYEITRTISNKIIEGGQIQNLSVAVLIDGIYTKDDNGKVTYQERSTEELDKIRKLVSSAIGLDPKRGDTLEVINLKFVPKESSKFEQEQPQSTMNWIKQDLQSLIQSIIIGIVTILAMILIIRPLVLKAIENKDRGKPDAGLGEDILNKQTSFSAASSPEEQLPDRSLEDMLDIKTQEDSRQSNNNVTLVNKLVDDRPEEAASIIRSWLNDNK